MPLELVVIGPEGVMLSERADYVYLTARDGSIGVLKGHAPMVAALAKGPLKYRQGSEEHIMQLDKGVAEICRDKIVVLVD